MKRVLKYTVPVDGQWHEIGVGDIAFVACQNSADTVQVWVVEDSEANASSPSNYVPRARVHGTGHPVEDDAHYAGSALAAGGSLVWHVFVR